MKVSELGEFGLIDLLAKMVTASQAQQPPNPRLYIGIGDDAAAWRIPDEVQLASVDTMVQDVHFSTDIISWKALGWKSLAINISDIAAMAGVPDYALVALNLPDDTLVEDVTQLYEGMLELARQFGISLIGGNISRSPVISITITVLGSGREDILLRRSTARPGDLVAVTGYTGHAAAGLKILTQKMEIPEEDQFHLLRPFTHPVPRMIEAQTLVRRGIITAIDISDGLISDLGHICQASRVGARINVDKLPIHEVLVRHFGEEEARQLTLTGGEAYELLFTGSPKAVKAAMKDITMPVTVIGEITEEDPGHVSLTDDKGNLFGLDQPGWRHF